jgi:hypothetical protein
MKKINKVSSNIDLPSEERPTELTNLDTKDLLPLADFQSVIPSVVEVTTKNLEKVSGIMIPFKSKVVLGEKSIEVKFSAVEVNPNFSEKDWSVPNQF